MTDFFRSKTMDLFHLTVNKVAAGATLNAIGETGRAHFVDINRNEAFDLNAGYTRELKKREKALRELTFLVEVCCPKFHVGLQTPSLKAL